MQNLSLNVQTRNEKGKNACNRIRSAGFIPAVMYSHGTAQQLQVPSKEFSKMFKGHISESVLINLVFTDKGADNTHQVFIKDYQRDPVTDQIWHLDFYKVTLGEKIHTKVPVEVTGTPKGVRMGGILEIIERELEIECLPREMPEKINVDVTNLNMGESIHIKDLTIGSSIKFLSDPDRVIVTVLTPHKAVETAEGGAAEIEETGKSEASE